MIRYGEHHIDQNDINSVKKVLHSKLITQGPIKEKFEQAISIKLKVKFALGVNSATSGLHIANLALGINKNSIVWTTPNTFVSTLNSSLFCNVSKIKLIDIDKRSWMINLDILENNLIQAKKNNLLPNLITVVHLGGNIIDLARLKKLSKMYNFKIIEDASHALGAKYKKEYIGSCKYSDITIFSLHPVKSITSGEGGIATTNSKKLFELMSYYSNHGIIKDEKKFKNKKYFKNYYEQHYIGFNYRINEIQSALALSQLNKLDKFINYRNKIAFNYDQAFRGLKNILIQKINLNVYSSYHLYIIIIKGIKNIKLLNLLKNKYGILTTCHYKPIHLQPYFKHRFKFRKGMFPISEWYGDNAVTLPIHYNLTFNQQKKIINSIKEIANNIFS